MSSFCVLFIYDLLSIHLLSGVITNRVTAWSRLAVTRFCYNRQEGAERSRLQSCSGKAGRSMQQQAGAGATTLLD